MGQNREPRIISTHTGEAQNMAEVPLQFSGEKDRLFKKWCWKIDYMGGKLIGFSLIKLKNQFADGLRT